MKIKISTYIIFLKKKSRWEDGPYVPIMLRQLLKKSIYYKISIKKILLRN